MAYELDLNHLPADELEKLKAQATEIGGELRFIAQKIYDIVDLLTKGHEETLVALRDEDSYRAFVESLTAEDLRGVGITEDSIQAFLSAPLEERLETVHSLDIFTVYQLYESKPRTPPIIAKMQTAQELRQELFSQLQALTQHTEGLTAMGWIRQSEIAERAEALEARRTAKQEDVTITVTLEDLI